MPVIAWSKQRMRSPANGSSTRGASRSTAGVRSGAGGRASPRILLLGHLDTVWPLGTLQRMPFTAEADRMTGPGVFDMKAGVVQGWSALARIGARSDGPVGMLLTTDEETGSLASRDLIAEAITACEAVLVLEPSADGALKTQRKGTSWYHLTFHGRAAHAGLDPETRCQCVGRSGALHHRSRHLVGCCGRNLRHSHRADIRHHRQYGSRRSNTHLDCRAWTRAEQERVDGLVRSWILRHPEASWSIDGGIDRAALETSQLERTLRASQASGRRSRPCRTNRMRGRWG